MLSKVELRGLPMPQKKKPKPRESKGFGILDGVVPVTATHNAEPTSVNKLEHDALFAAASEIRNQCRRDYIVEDEPQVLVDSKRQKGRGKGQNKRGQRKNAQNSGNKVDDANNKVAASDKPEISSSEHKGQTADNDSAVTDGYPENKLKGAREILRRHTQQPGSSYSNVKQIPPVYFYAQESDQPILDILKPSVIIVYHPDMTFVREIEVYKAENPSKNLKVYFLFYEDSTEVQKFEASIHRENGAFESLIRQKSLMMIPVDQVCYS